MGAMILEPWFQKGKEFFRVNEKSSGWQLFCILRTFLLVSVLKVFPGSVSTSALFGMIGKFFTDIRLPVGWEELFPGLTTENVIFLAMALVLLFVIDFFAEKGDIQKYFADRPFVLRWLCYGFLLIFILCMGSFGLDMKGGFAYAQY